VIRGRVQGVGYRAWAAEAAYERGLAGWVRNRRDGTVEAVFFGTAVVVITMVDSCRQGPPGARVEEVYELDAQIDALSLRRPGELFSLLPTV
jgi:acylphosphatase